MVKNVGSGSNRSGFISQFRYLLAGNLYHFFKSQFSHLVAVKIKNDNKCKLLSLVPVK